VGNTLAGVQQGDNTYALPIDLEPFIMRYSSDKFTAANLPQPADYTWTVQQFNDALTALKPNTQGQAPFLDNGWYETYLALVASYGGLPIDYRTNPPTVNFTDPATVAAIQQVLDLARNGYLDYTGIGQLPEGTMSTAITDRTSIYPDRLNGW